jgi:hypothetical protein
MGNSGSLRCVGVVASLDGRALLAVALLCLGSACVFRKSAVHPELRAAGDQRDALAVSDALEALIAAGQDTPADREWAYDIVRRHEEDTAPSMFARAAVTGRLVQQRGLTAAHLVPEVERCGRRSRDLDPDFRNGAATRLLGTLYVIAPAVLLQHGDSEVGLQLLEGLVQTHPEVLENHLRLAEAYIALGDPTPARPHLCRCLADQAALRLDDQRLLHQLIDDALLGPCVPPTVAPATEPGDPRPAGRGTVSTAPPGVR